MEPRRADRRGALPGRRAERHSCGREGMELNHIKPHGSLYGMAARDEQVAAAVADAADVFGVPLMGMAGTVHEQVWGERPGGFIVRVLRRPRLPRRRLADHHPRARRVRPGHVGAERRRARRHRGGRHRGRRHGDPGARRLRLRALRHPERRRPRQGRARGAAALPDRPRPAPSAPTPRSTDGPPRGRLAHPRRVLPTAGPGQRRRSPTPGQPVGADDTVVPGRGHEVLPPGARGCGRHRRGVPRRGRGRGRRRPGGRGHRDRG